MATEIGELVWKINGDTRNFDSNLKKSETGLKKFGGGIKKFAIGAAAAFAAIGITKMSKELVRAASDAEETQNKFDVVFRGIGDAAGDAAEELATGFGLSRTASQGLLADSADLLQGFGVSKQASLELSSEVQKLAADLASFTNFSGGAAGASAALTKGLLGEREAMKSLGIAITETELKRFAEEQNLVFEELDKAEKAFLTFDLAVRQSGNAIGDFARSQASFANQSRIAQANIDNLKVTFGEALLPLANLGVTAFNNLASGLEDLAVGFRDFTRSAEGAGIISGVLGTLAGSFSVLVEIGKTLFDPLKEGISGILEPIKELSSEVGGTGIVFDIFGGVVQYVAGFIRVLTTAVREQIEFIIQFGRTVVSTGELAVEALKSIFNRERRADLRAQAEGVAADWADTGRELVDVYATTFGAIKNEAVSFVDGARDNSDAFANAYEQGFQRVKSASEAALLGAGEPGQTPGVQAAEDEYQAWLQSYTEQLAARLEFEEETRLIVQEAEDERTRITEEAEAERAKIRDMFIQQSFATASSLASSLATISDNRGEKELQNLQKRIDAEAEGSAERIALEEEYERRSAELQREAAQRQKALGIFNAVISTAQAIIGFLANPGGIPGIALSALAGITGAAQIAAISSEPLPALAEGGIVPPTPGGRVVRVAEAEQAEAIIPLEEEGGLPIRIIVNLPAGPIVDTVQDAMNRREIIVEATG